MVSADGWAGAGERSRLIRPPPGPQCPRRNTPCPHRRRHTVSAGWSPCSECSSRAAPAAPREHADAASTRNVTRAPCHTGRAIQALIWTGRLMRLEHPGRATITGGQNGTVLADSHTLGRAATGHAIEHGQIGEGRQGVRLFCPRGSTIGGLFDHMHRSDRVADELAWATNPIERGSHRANQRRPGVTTITRLQGDKGASDVTGPRNRTADRIQVSHVLRVVNPPRATVYVVRMVPWLPTA